MSDGNGLSDSRRQGMDKPLFIAVLMLAVFGAVMVYSASAVMAQKQMNNATHFLGRQIIYGFIGLVGMIVVSRLDYHIFQKSFIVWGLLAISFLGLLVCKTGFGVTSHGAARWIRMGPITIQPSEAMKVAVVLWLSYSLSKKSLKIKSFSIGFLPHLIIPGVVMMGCMLQPDFGTTVVIAILTFSLLFVAGAKLGYIMLAGIVATPIVYFLITGSAYRLARMMTFMDPLATRFTTGYQLSQSLFAYASGGITGVGIGDSLQKFLFLPEAHNDFIGAIIGEELGVVGIWVLLIAYAVVVWRGIRIGLKAKDEFGMFVAFGLSILIAVQVLANLGVSMGLLPTKGLNLPFVSFGGSALLISMAAIGILLSISRGSKGSESIVSDGEESKGTEEKSVGQNRRKSRSKERV